jgi:gamma-glutamylcyclotransferase (GGCT)/AIG2-like uncharacterized protein YtfP
VEKSNDAATLFVYGSLLDSARRDGIIGHPVETAPAVLHGYERGRARYFYIREEPGQSIAGLLLLNLTPHDFRKLDCYEEIPRLYTRTKVVVSDTEGIPRRCWVYLPTAAMLSGEQ